MDPIITTSSPKPVKAMLTEALAERRQRAEQLASSVQELREVRAEIKQLEKALGITRPRAKTTKAAA